ncbi:uncharacterized protein LOC142333756 [Lycorma delicatula]|uniref:uncharacterized protein LOC142333756 n=1 Tax=Lycorma delicatula TaxID=130591 RepID=UPI003F50E12E
MNTKFDDSFVEEPLCVYIKQEINQDEVEDNGCLYMPDVKLEKDQTSDDKINPQVSDLLENEIPVCPEVKVNVKHEVEETLFVSVIKTEDALTSGQDIDKSYLLPEKEDPLDIGCSGSNSSNGISTKIELHKFEQFDIKCEEAEFGDERVCKAPENVDFTMSTGKCAAQNINKDNFMHDDGIRHKYDDLQSMSFKETISTEGEDKKREQYNVYVNSSLNNSNCYEYNRLRDEMFHCYDCGEVYVVKSKISNHLCKGVRKFYCIICSESSVSEETLKIHSCNLNKKNDIMNGDDINKKSQSENFTENNFVSTVIHKIIQHKRHINDCGKYKCKFCEKIFKCKRTLIFHSNIHTEKSSHKCTFCQKSFNQRGTLKRHLNIHTIEKKFKCNFCEKAFKDRGNLRKHIFVHTGEERFTCNFCQKSVRKSYFKKHISIHTSEKKFTCDFCQKSFHRSGDLKKHFSIHTGEKNFKCNFCGKFYNHNSDLNRHLKIHTGEKKFTCDFCGKSFSRSDYFKIHLSNHSSEKKFTCNICIKSFTQSRDLKRHLSIHTDEKKFTCNVCEKGFSQNSHLKRHLFIHYGEKKFTCNLCERSFYQNSDLKRHISIHTGEKKFSCKFCEKSFSRGSSLKVHLAVHTGKNN